MRKRLLWAAACVALLAGGLWAWRQSQPVVLRVAFWAESYWNVPTSDNYAVLDAAIEKFQQSHPQVRVEYTSGVLVRDYTEWLIGKLLKGDAPDVMLIPPDDFDMFASVKALEDLSALPGARELLDADLFYPAALSAGQWEGRQYALPYECVPRLMFVNKTLLESEGIPLPESGWTWADFYAICSRITKDTDGNGTPDQFGCCNYTWEDAAFSNAVQLFPEGSKSCNLAGEELFEATTFVVELNQLLRGQSVSEKAFEAGQAAFLPMLFSEYRAYQSHPWSIKKYSTFAWDCLQMPAGPSGGNVSELITLLAGINSQSHHKRLAWELLQTLTCDEEIQQLIYTSSQGCSPLRAVTTAPETARIFQMSNPNGSMDMSMLDDTLRGAATVPRFRRYQQVMEAVRGRVEQAMKTPDNLKLNLTSAQVYINRLLKN